MPSRPCVREPASLRAYDAEPNTPTERSRSGSSSSPILRGTHVRSILPLGLRGHGTSRWTMSVTAMVSSGEPGQQYRRTFICAVFDGDATASSPGPGPSHEFSGSSIIQETDLGVCQPGDAYRVRRQPKQSRPLPVRQWAEDLFEWSQSQEAVQWWETGQLSPISISTGGSLLFLFIPISHVTFEEFCDFDTFLLGMFLRYKLSSMVEEQRAYKLACFSYDTPPALFDSKFVYSSLLLKDSSSYTRQPQYVWVIFKDDICFSFLRRLTSALSRLMSKHLARLLRQDHVHTNKMNGVAFFHSIHGT